MKKTAKISYRQKTKEELQKTLKDAKKMFLEAKSKFATGNQKDTSVFKKIQYEIAYIQTLLSENKNEKNNK
jgi:ribosomal protein L29